MSCVSYTRTGQASVQFYWTACVLFAALLFLPVVLPAQVVPDSQATDTLRAQLPALLPMRVTERRERSVPPPVVAIRMDTVAIRRAPSTTAYDLVRRVSSLEVHEQGQGPGFTSNVVVRGFNSDHSADALLVVDGIPVNSPIHGHVEGFADWNVILPIAVSDMRFIAGSASPMHGDFALAGVMEVFTAADAEGLSGDLNVSGFGDASVTMKTGVKRQSGGFLTAFDARRQNGWQKHSAYQLGNGIVRAWKNIAGGRLEGGVQLYGSRWDSPGFVSVGRYNANDLRSYVDSTDGGDNRRLMASLRYGRTAGRFRGKDISLETTLWTQHGEQQMFLNVPGEGSVMRQSEENDQRNALGGQFQLAVPLGLGEVIAGVSARKDGSDYTRYTTFSRSRSSLDHSYDAEFSSQSAFVRWRSLPHWRLSLDLGARMDRLSYKVVDRVALANSNGNRLPSKAAHTIASPKLGARYLLPWTPAGLSLAALVSTSHGFRGAVGAIDSPARQPVLAWSNELGLDISNPDMNAHIALFMLNASNERIFDPVSQGVSSSGKSRRQGVDARGTWNVGRSLETRDKALWFVPPELQLSTSFTWNHARILGEISESDVPTVRPGDSGNIHDHSIPILPGDPVPGVAKVTARIVGEGKLYGSSETMNSQYAKWQVSYRVLGGFVPIGEPGLYTKTASVLDAGIQIPMPVMFGSYNSSAGISLENALDLRYVENRASGFITPGVPRTIRLTLSFE